MGFLNRLGEITKRKTFEAKFDFGFGDGEEDVTFRALSYAERKKIFTSRNKVLGQKPDGTNIIGIDVQNEALDLNAEVLAASFVKPDGKPVAAKDAYMSEWDSDLVDKLATLCMKTIGLAKDKEADEEGEGEENPSQPQT